MSSMCRPTPDFFALYHMRQLFTRFDHSFITESECEVALPTSEAAFACLCIYQLGRLVFLFQRQAERAMLSLRSPLEAVGEDVVSAPACFFNFSPIWECRKMAGKRVQPLNNYAHRLRPPSLKCTDKSRPDELQSDKQWVIKAAYLLYADHQKLHFIPKKMTLSG